MGSRSKLGQKQKRRPNAQHLQPQPPDHHADKALAVHYVKKHPDSDLAEVANACFDGCCTIAFRALNTLRNQGVLRRENDRYTWVNMEYERHWGPMRDLPVLLAKP